MDGVLAALQSPHPEWPRLGRAEIEVCPAQIDSLADPQPMTKHQSEQELVAVALATHIACCLDQAPCFVR